VHLHVPNNSAVHLGPNSYLNTGKQRVFRVEGKEIIPRVLVIVSRVFKRVGTLQVRSRVDITGKHTIFFVRLDRVGFIAIVITRINCHGHAGGRPKDVHKRVTVNGGGGC
jgi:hypothetical protein